MAYKRNPMRSERICGLARFVMSLPASAAANARHAVDGTHARRQRQSPARAAAGVPGGRRGADALPERRRGLVVYPQVIARHLREELPFMATENILMAAVAAGGDRQDLHERIRQHSQAAAAVVKQQGGENDLLDRLRQDKAFAKSRPRRRRRSRHTSPAAVPSKSTNSSPKSSRRSRINMAIRGS